MTGADGPDDLHVVGEGSQPWRVVLLHGHAGSPEAMLGAAVALADAAPVQVVLPRGPVGVGDDHAWWEVGSEAGAEAVAAVAELVEGDGRPTVLAGFSQGGAMALRVAATTALPLAGVVVVAGFVPDELAGPPAEEVGLPLVLVLHGEADEDVDPMHGRLVANWCRRAGAEVVAATYEAGHDWVPATTAAVASWLAALPAPAGG